MTTRSLLAHTSRRLPLLRTSSALVVALLLLFSGRHVSADAGIPLPSPSLTRPSTIDSTVTKVTGMVLDLVGGQIQIDVSGAAIANLEVETLIHRYPTFHGDTIYAETRVLDTTPSTSKPDRGVVLVETKGFNQDGLEVCYFRRKVMVWMRDFAPPRQRPYGDDVWE